MPRAGRVPPRSARDSPAHRHPLHPLLDGELVGHRPAGGGHQLCRVAREEAGQTLTAEPSTSRPASRNCSTTCAGVRPATSSSRRRASLRFGSSPQRPRRALGHQLFGRSPVAPTADDGNADSTPESARAMRASRNVVELGLAATARPRRQCRLDCGDGHVEVGPRRVDPSHQLTHVAAARIRVDGRIGRRLRRQSQIRRAERPAGSDQRRRSLSSGSVANTVCRRRATRVRLDEPHDEIADGRVAVRPPPATEGEVDASRQLRTRRPRRWWQGRGRSAGGRGRRPSSRRPGWWCRRPRRRNGSVRVVR